MIKASQIVGIGNNILGMEVGSVVVHTTERQIKQTLLSTGEYIYELANHKGNFPDLEGNVKEPGIEKDDSVIREEYLKLSDTTPYLKENPPISESEAISRLGANKNVVIRVGNKYTTIFEESRLKNTARDYPEGRRAFYEKADSNEDGVIDEKESKEILDQ